ncbi:MAG: hypothetical protein LQ338_004479 [Usnochroma carphineum]|nr:MAG: hypothetical protein LQ338_004479 [Usnochroma carphineum]
MRLDALSVPGQTIAEVGTSITTIPSSAASSSSDYGPHCCSQSEYWGFRCFAIKPIGHVLERSLLAIPIFRLFQFAKPRNKGFVADGNKDTHKLQHTLQSAAMGSCDRLYFEPA